MHSVVSLLGPQIPGPEVINERHTAEPGGWAPEDGQRGEARRLEQGSDTAQKVSEIEGIISVTPCPH